MNIPDSFIEWWSDNWLEWVGAVTGIVNVYLNIKQNPLTWPISLISIFCYLFVFFNAGLYADFGLFVFYFFASIYGWYKWVAKPDADNNILKISTIGFKLHVLLSIIAIALTFFIGFGLSYIKSASVPYFDAFTTSFSLIAVYLLSHKKIENWYWWIIVDLVAAGVYFYKELYLTTALYLIFTAMAIAGYRAWKKQLTNKPTF